MFLSVRPRKFISGDSATTQIGYVNKNGQECRGIEIRLAQEVFSLLTRLSAKLVIMNTVQTAAICLSGGAPSVKVVHLE